MEYYWKEMEKKENMVQKRGISSRMEKEKKKWVGELIQLIYSTTVSFEVCSLLVEWEIQCENMQARHVKFKWTDFAYLMLEWIDFYGWGLTKNIKKVSLHIRCYEWIFKEKELNIMKFDE